MADVHSIEVRSYNMSRIRAKDTKPELMVRKFLFSIGLRYRLHVNNLPGKPDIVLPRFKTAIFVHGCFWHGHEECKYFVVPKTRTDWWMQKITRNRQLDVEAVNNLTNTGWKVLIIYECELKKLSLARTLNTLFENITLNIK
jgi:DNA mismatch endonuclease (patch repair protein)